ncbi:MAG: tRNA threonylcarbamoyladenosine dehydratase [Oscillospiraceae bacterium]|nr:tRNA threonylcarbamoyladenosine dehydratase [Oscillospiraceae bacterium]
MDNYFSRSALLLGEDNMEKLKNAHVAVFGIGGVGGYVTEALARTGIGSLDLFDNDTVSPTNINRQIIATTENIGKYKVDVMKERISLINPNAQVNAYRTFYMPENSADYDFTQYDYIVDAIDTVTAKIELVMRTDEAGTPVISSMGTGNKLDPTAFEVTDIYKTSVCPLARVMRRELKQRGIKRLKVVYSKEEPIKPLPSDEITSKRNVPGSLAFVPPVAGLIIAGEVIKDLIK